MYKRDNFLYLECACWHEHVISYPPVVPNAKTFKKDEASPSLIQFHSLEYIRSDLRQILKRRTTHKANKRS